jgi:ABC-type Fe3+/spermidine/putrescine transport system ATPase subunit
MPDTQVTCDCEQATITFTKVDCTSYDINETPHTKRDVEVVFQHYEGSSRFFSHKHKTPYL